MPESFRCPGLELRGDKGEDSCPGDAEVLGVTGVQGVRAHVQPGGSQGGGAGQGRSRQRRKDDIG